MKKAIKFLGNIFRQKAKKVWYEDLQEPQWVEQFKSLPLYSQERCDLLESHTNGALYNYGNYINQKVILPWSVVYRILQIFDKFDVSIKFPVCDDSFNASSFENHGYRDEMYDIIKSGYINTFRAKINTKENVEIMFLIAEGSRGDEDGYGVGPDIWAYGVIDKDGSIMVPFHL